VDAAIYPPSTSITVDILSTININNCRYSHNSRLFHSDSPVQSITRTGITSVKHDSAAIKQKLNLIKAAPISLRLTM